MMSDENKMSKEKERELRSKVLELFGEAHTISFDVIKKGAPRKEPIDIVFPIVSLAYSSLAASYEDLCENKNNELIKDLLYLLEAFYGKVLNSREDKENE